MIPKYIAVMELEPWDYTWDGKYPDASAPFKQNIYEVPQDVRIIKDYNANYLSDRLTLIAYYKGSYSKSVMHIDDAMYKNMYTKEMVIKEMVSNLSKYLDLNKHQEKFLMEAALELSIDSYTKPKGHYFGGIIGHGTEYSVAPNGGNPNDISTQTRKLPGVMSKVKPGCGCESFKGGDGLVILWNHIQHLNDKHRWTREEIADWCQKLHDSGEVNLEFDPWKSEEEILNEQD